MSKTSEKSPLKKLMEQFPKKGKLEWVGIRPKRKADLVPFEEIIAVAGIGLEGDHYKSKNGKRQVTLIQKEHLDVIGKFVKQDVSIEPFLLRRNLVISGINLLALHKRQIAIGEEVVLEITGYCHPCSRMEENLGHGGYNAMRGHGGMTAKIIKGGKLKIGDAVSFLEE